MDPIRELAEKLKANFNADDLNKLTKANLIEVSKYLGIELKTCMRKDAIVQSLTCYFVGETDSEATDSTDPKENEAILQNERLKFEIEKFRIEQTLKFEFEMEKLRLEYAAKSAVKESNLSNQIRLVPKFDCDEVESFFQNFERVAYASKWPKENWPLLIQTALTGKAQKVYVALSDDNAKDYDIVKAEILRAYELVPEAYRQRFRGKQKDASRSYLDFAKEQETLFDKWCSSANVNTFASLRQLILIEQFKTCSGPSVRAYLDERNLTSLQEAARAADQYDLTHRISSSEKKTHFKSPRKENPSSELTDTRKRNETVECKYCKKKGHLITDCWTLKRKQSKPDRKFVAFAKCNSLNRKSFPIEARLIERKREERLLAEGEKAFTTVGSVGIHETDQKPIKLMRDSCSYQSLLLKGVVPISNDTFLGETVLIQGIAGKSVVPLHKVFLKSDLITGQITVGIIDELPINGVHLLIGNELMGGQVFAPKKTENSIADGEPISDEVPTCAVTRSMSKNKTDDDEVSLSDTFIFSDKKEPEAETGKGNENRSCFKLDRETLIRDQKDDVELEKCFFLAENQSHEKVPHYFIDNGVLLRKWRPIDVPADEEWHTVNQIVVPSKYRAEVISLAHDHPWAGHLGIRKTRYRLLKHYFWPGVLNDVASYCRSCETCQIVGKPNIKPDKAPLMPIPASEEPFSRVIVDCVGPLPKSKHGFQYLLTIMCASTRFPEAIPLRNITARAVTDALIKFFSMFGLPKTIQTDQGSNFMSKVFNQIMKELHIKHSFSSAYHPQSQGALERFHQTLKSMLRAYCHENDRDWNQGIPLVLFAVRETVQESLGFSPFELIFGHSVRGSLQMLKETWLQTERAEASSLLEYVSDFRKRLTEVRKLAKSNLAESQRKMKLRYDASSNERSFPQVRRC